MAKRRSKKLRRKRNYIMKFAELQRTTHFKNVRKRSNAARKGWATRKRKKGNRWIQRAFKKSKRGALHRALKIPLGRKIPIAKLRWAAKKPGLIGKRARMILNLRYLVNSRGKVVGRVNERTERP